MSYQNRIQACNNFNPAEFVPFMIAARQVGWIRPAFANRLAMWPTVFSITRHSVTLSNRLECFESRTEALGKVVTGLFADGTIMPRSTPESYSVCTHHRDDALCAIDRAAASHFGVRAFGQHINGYIRQGDSFKMWVGVRSLTKPNEPGKLDQIVAGGLPHGLTEQENLVKECAEEADIPACLASAAIPVGYISYNAQTADGAKPDTMLCYDLELPEDFQPCCTDGEVDDFLLMDIEEVAHRVRDTNDFKANCNLVVIDFLIRHGYLDTRVPEFEKIRQSLRPPTMLEMTPSHNQYMLG